VELVDTIRKCLWDRSTMIFDNAALAIWFYGDFFSKEARANTEAWGAYERIPAMQYDLTWSQDADMKMSYPLWGSIRVASLHMHSKQLEKVASYTCEGDCNREVPFRFKLHNKLPQSNVINMTSLNGRSGNRIISLQHALTFALKHRCHVLVSTEIIDGWIPTGNIFEHPNPDPQNNACTQTGGSQFFDKTKIDEEPGETVLHALRQFLGTNSSHSLGKSCPPETFTGVHIRSGDMLSGSFDQSAGQFISFTPINKLYGPHPTSYYVEAIRNMALTNHTFVFCEDNSNPSCDFFVKAARLPGSSILVRTEEPLIDDLYLLLCARELAFSMGTFKSMLRVSERATRFHEFTATPIEHCPSNRKEYHISEANDRETYRREIKSNQWQNSEWHRYLVDKAYQIASC